MGTQFLPALDAAGVIAAAKLLEIDNKETGTRTPWVPTAEQERMALESCAAPWVIVAKPRQIYASTYFCLEDVLWTHACDRSGHKVRVAIVVDTDPKAAGRLDVCEDFARQLRMGAVRYHASNQAPERLVFPNGSVIYAFSAGGRRAGSSLSFHRYHFTELPYWQGASAAYGSLMPALSKGPDAQVKIETTMDVVGDPLARNLWVTKNRYKKVFFSVEDHETYRADPDSITDSQWEWAKEHGYTDRAAAAWFIAAIDDECGGDTDHAFHMYPQITAHLFQFAAGRFIRVTPDVAKPRRIVQVEGASDSWALEIYREPKDTSGQCAIGVDTAGGKGRDYSTVVVLDKRDWRVCASFASNTIWGDDLAAVVKAAQEEYAREHPKGLIIGVAEKPPVKPLAYVEENGVGEETYHKCIRLGVQCRAVWTDEAVRLAALLWVKRQSEAGILYGPDVLAKEAESLHRDDKGQFGGRKDWCIAAGLAGSIAEREAPYRQPETAEPRDRLNLKKVISRERLRQKRRRQ